ncbi:MAG: hypothetical protein IKS45_00085 [Thermoguttaceae bacterium]|nr:hypothetical protein [Thermoguttaceae bacterium]
MKRILFIVLTLLLAVPALAQETDNGLTVLMKKHGLPYSTAQATPTICALCGVDAPKDCVAKPIDVILTAAKDKPAMEKVLIFCPDATGKFLVNKYQEDWKPVYAASTHVVSAANVLPSVTPVCFGAIFTGCPPEIHGILQYNDKYKPNPIKVETLFDAFSKAGKKCAVIAEKNCSIDLIFRGHQADFYTTKNSEESVATAKKLLQENNYDLIVCYDGNYDSTMHANGVFAEKSIAAMKDSIRYYTELVEVADQVWADKNYVSVFSPDHGAHDAKEGKGTHGSAQASDAIVNHFYRLRYVNK